MLGENQPNKDVTIFAPDFRGDASTTLRTAIAQYVYMFLVNKRGEDCTGCSKFNKTGGDHYKNLKEQGHSCVNTVKGSGGNASITNDEWKLASDKMVNEHVIQAYLLMEKLASPNQISTLDVARFLILRRQPLDNLINIFLRDAVYFNDTIFHVAV